MLGWTEEEWLEPGFWEAHLHPDDRDGRRPRRGPGRRRSGIDHELELPVPHRRRPLVHLHDLVTVVGRRRRPHRSPSTA